MRERDKIDGQGSPTAGHRMGGSVEEWSERLSRIPPLFPDCRASKSANLRRSEHRLSLRESSCFPWFEEPMVFQYSKEDDKY